MTSLAGQHALVTGAAVRIGRAIALALAGAGVRVGVHYRNSEADARALVDELNSLSSGNYAVGADLTVESERSRLIPRVAEGKGPLHILVNNASVYRRKPLAQIDHDQVDKDMSVNFTAPLLLMRDFAESCRRGCIINMLDQRVAKTERSAGTYGLAKKSLRDATEAAALEWAPAIRVNGVAPGFVLPPPGVGMEKMKHLLAEVPMRRTTDPGEIAEACLFLARAETITGQILYVDGGMHLEGGTVRERTDASYDG